jgi:hypothetical protein
MNAYHITLEANHELNQAVQLLRPIRGLRRVNQSVEEDPQKSKSPAVPGL